MGLDSENAARIVFDIETAPLPDAGEYLEPVDAPANYKDPAKIAAFIAEKQQENLDRAGLDVDLCRIVAIAWQKEGNDSPTVFTRADCIEEGLIEEFWNQVARFNPHLVGFNCLGFDLPVLLRRSQYLGIVPPSIQIDKFKHPQVSDLMQILSFNGAIRARSLAFYCKRFGIIVEDTLTGADVALAVREERWADIRQHVSADVQRTAQLAAKVGLFRLPAITSSRRLLAKG